MRESSSPDPVHCLKYSVYESEHYAFERISVVGSNDLGSNNGLRLDKREAHRSPHYLLC